MENNKVEFTIYQDRCVWINDRRVAGKKVYLSENIKPQIMSTTLENVLDAFSIEDIESYIADKKGN